MFRRSGSVVSYFVDGKIPDPQDPSFCEALANHRFRTIENAASEETSIGWCTPTDPTGEAFELEDMDHDHAVWMRMRLDKKSLPSKWMAIYRTSAEKAAGRKLSATEKRELKEDLSDKLLPRILPSVNLVDMLYVPKQKIVMLFGTSTRVKEEFNKLWFKTFASNVIEADPYSLATRIGLDRDTLAQLEEATPVPWPRPEGSAPQRRPVDEGPTVASDAARSVASITSEQRDSGYASGDAMYIDEEEGDEEEDAEEEDAEEEDAEELVSSEAESSEGDDQ